MRWKALFAAVTAVWIKSACSEKTCSVTDSFCGPLGRLGLPPSILCRLVKDHESNTSAEPSIPLPMTDMEAEIIAVTQRLLNAIAAGDWTIYTV